MIAPKVYYPRCRAILHVVLDGYDDTAEGGAQKPMVVGVLPTAANVHKNKYLQADEFELTFSGVDLPFDPKVLRAGEVEIHMYDAGRMDSGVVESRQDLSVIKFSGRAGARRNEFTEDSDPQIVGLFDRHTMELAENGKWVILHGKDYTQLLLKHWPPTENHRARRIPVGSRLDRWAESIIGEVDPSGKLTVVTEGIEVDKLPIVGAAEVANHKRGIPIKQETTYLDVLFGTCRRYGLICFVRGRTFVISAPKGALDESMGNVKRMAWGRNISSLTMTRNLGMEKVPRAVVRSYDDETGETITVEVPDSSLHHKEIAIANRPSLKLKSTEVIKSAAPSSSVLVHRPKKSPVPTVKERYQDEFVILTMYGVTDKAAMRRFGETYRTMIGRGERKVTLRTHELEDFDGSSLLGLMAGDAVSVEWQDFNREVMQNPATSKEERIAWLTARGYQSQVAAMLAGQYDKMINKNERPLRMRECTLGWHVNGGLDIEMELEDFVVLDEGSVLASLVHTPEMIGLQEASL